MQYLISCHYTIDQGVLSEVTWKKKCKEDGKSKHKKVPGRIPANDLQVREVNNFHHPREYAEEGSEHRV